MYKCPPIEQLEFRKDLSEPTLSEQEIELCKNAVADKICNKEWKYPNVQLPAKPRFRILVNFDRKIIRIVKFETSFEEVKDA